MFLLALAVACAAPSLRFGSFPAIPVGTDRDAVNFLVAIHRSIPQTLNSSVFFPRDIRELLAKQRLVRQQLQENPSYHDLEAQRPRPFHLLVKPREDDAEAVEAQILDPEAVKDWRRELLNALYNCPANGVTGDRFALKNLSQSLSLELQKPSPRSPAYLVQVALFLQRFLKESSDQYKFRDSLNAVEEGDLDYFHEREIIETELTSILGNKPALTRSYLGSIHGFLDAIERRKIKRISHFTGTLSIEDVGPDVAIFRGFFGNDCSTMLSFPYPYSPLERTFFLFDQNRNRLGYGAGTHVLFNGRPAFYFHTINGPWITSAQVDQVIDALYRSREQLGVEALVLPTPDRASSNINFSPIRSVFLSKIQESAARPGSIKHLDSALRGPIFHPASRGNYDLEVTNSRGFEYIPARNPDDFTTVTRELDPPDVITPITDDSGATPAEILLLAHGLSRVSGRDDTARWVLETYGISATDWHDYCQLVGNRQGNPAYLASVRAGLTRWGMSPEQAEAAVTQYADYFDGSRPHELFSPPRAAWFPAPRPMAANPGSLVTGPTPARPAVPSIVPSTVSDIQQVENAHFLTSAVPAVRQRAAEGLIAAKPTNGKVILWILAALWETQDDVSEAKRVLDTISIPVTPEIVSELQRLSSNAPDRNRRNFSKRLLKKWQTTEACDGSLKTKRPFWKFW